MKNLLLIIALCLCSVFSNATTYYVAPGGSDSNPGTISAPFATWDKLSSVMVAGDIAYLRGGTYRSTKGAGGSVHCLLQNLHGTASNMIKIWAYPGEFPVFNLDNITPTYTDPTAIELLNSEYVHLKGVRITGLKQHTGGNGISRGFHIQNANHCTIEFLELDHIGGVGYYLRDGANDNYFLNCDAHHNDDRYSAPDPWGGSDGFSCAGGVNATRNTYEGCRAWWNSDDGWDFFGVNAIATLKNCWSFWNGYQGGTFSAAGDGNGYKLGPDESYINGGSSTVHNTLLRTVTNCLAFENKQSGFSQNVGDMKYKLYNNTSFKNGATGYMWDYVSPAPVQDFKNNVSYMDASVRRGNETNGSNNTWNGIVTVNSADFLSVSSSGADGPRGSDGSLPVLNFLHLNTASDLVNSGINVGLSFLSSAPDMGAFEANGGVVNNPPTSNAGSDQVITLPTNSVSLTGTGTDVGGSITGYSWTKLSGPAGGTITTSTSASTAATALVQGVYQFQLQVTDNNGATATDMLQVTVNAAATNPPPTANAGTDKTISLPTSSVSLTGSGTDANGTISGYLWTKLSGPAGGTIATATAAATSVTALVQGVYQFQLKVTDNNGATGTDNVQVTVNAATESNVAPTANAGNNKWLTLPTNYTSLPGVGTDPNGSISSYAWSKVSGPATGSLTNATSATATATGLVAGAYIWELKVTDNLGAVGRDSVYTTVGTAAAYTSISTMKVIRVNVYNGNDPYNDSKWNNWKPTANVGSGNFKFENGAVSTVNAVLSKQNQVLNNGSSYLTSASICPTAVLKYTSANQASRTLTVKGLNPAKQYSFEFYSSASVSGSKTKFSINGNSYTVSTYNNGGAYAPYYNITPSSSGTIVVTLSTVGRWNYLSAFAIIEQSGTVSARSMSPETEGKSNDGTDVEDAVTVTTFPLPFSTSFTVNLHGGVEGEYDLTLVDMNGKIVLKKTVSKNAVSATETIYMGNLANGVYILQVVSPDETKTTQKLIKN